MADWRKVLSWRTGVPQVTEHHDAPGYTVYFRGTSYASVWVEASSFEEARAIADDEPLDADPPEDWGIYYIEKSNGVRRFYG
jgi:hypothetical protein